MPGFNEFLKPGQERDFHIVKRAIQAETNVTVDEVFAKTATPKLVEYMREVYPDAYDRVLKENQLDKVQAQNKINDGDFVFLKKALVELVKNVPLSDTGNRIYENLAKGAGIKGDQLKEAVDLLSIAGGIKVEKVLSKKD